MEVNKNMDCFEKEIARQERAKESQRQRNRRFREKREASVDIEKQRKVLESLPKLGDLSDFDFEETPKPISTMAQYRKNFQKKYPLKARAHKLVHQKLITGALRKKRCETCGAKHDIHAHHDDYSKPLSVRWLCRKHHQEWHRRHKARYNPAWEAKSAHLVRKRKNHSQIMVGDEGLEPSTSSV